MRFQFETDPLKDGWPIVLPSLQCAKRKKKIVSEQILPIAPLFDSLSV